MSNKPRPKTIKREQLANSPRQVYVGRATCVKLKNGVEVVLLSRSNENLQSVVDHLHLTFDQTPELDPKLIIDAAICDRRDLDLENDL